MSEEKRGRFEKSKRARQEIKAAHPLKGKHLNLG